MEMKSPPKVLTPEDIVFMSTLNECQRKQLLASQAIALDRHLANFSPNVGETSAFTLSCYASMKIPVLKA